MMLVVVLMYVAAGVELRTFDDVANCITTPQYVYGYIANSTNHNNSNTNHIRISNSNDNITATLNAITAAATT